MRLIDAEPIEKFIVNGLNEKNHAKRFGHDAIEILTEVHYAPTIAPPPNPPLTLEELREMDGEPAWVDGDRETEIGHSGWAIIWYSKVEKYVCIWWPGDEYADIPSLNSYGDTWLVYRRKPEEGTT